MATPRRTTIWNDLGIGQIDVLTTIAVVGIVGAGVARVYEHHQELARSEIHCEVGGREIVRPVLEIPYAARAIYENKPECTMRTRGM